MSDTAAGSRRTRPGKRSRSSEPDFIRTLVASSPLREAPAIAVIAESDDSRAAAASTTGDRAVSSGDAWAAHLAQLLHSMYLVTLTEKAQLGAMYNRSGNATPHQESRGQVPQTGGDRLASVGAGTGVSLPSSSHSLTVDERWLEAVTRYCHFSVTLDDVARVALVFPEQLQARWTADAAGHRADGVFLDGLAEGAVTQVAQGSQQPVSSTGECSGLAHSKATSGRECATGKLQGRVYLAENRVISVDEAVESVRAVLRAKGGQGAQRAWKALVNDHTAYDAYMASLKVAVDPEQKSSQGSPEKGSSSVPQAALHEPHGGSPPAMEIADEELYASISADLRASLSAAKLRALLQQMRKDASHVEEAEQQRIAQRQLQERLLNAYEHLRALFGAKETRGRSAMALITAMQQESRFEDALDLRALLSSLLEMPSSGLSATILREGRVVAEPVDRAPAKGVATRGKGRREAEGQQGKRGEAPVVVHVTEPTVEPVTDLRSLTDDQLDSVLVKLDRSRGSVRGVLEATTHHFEHTHSL